MKQLNKKLSLYIKEPLDAYKNADLANEYSKLGQGAAAVSFFVIASSKDVISFDLSLFSNFISISF